MATVLDTRTAVINGMALGIGPVIAAIDRLQQAAESGDPAQMRRAGANLYAERDRFLAPHISRLEEGREDW